jgi:hypothetical protein
LPQEYSRVTNPERFLPLHGHALGLLARLHATYDVVSSDTFELLPHVMHPVEHARPPVTLTPVVPGAAPIAVAFTSFPSLVVRYGRWHSDAFPYCACDACGENADREAARLDDLVARVVAGVFAEELRIPLVGDARLYNRFGDGTVAGPTGEGWTTLSWRAARAFARLGPRRVEWQPWPHRSGETG